MEVYLTLSTPVSYPAVGTWDGSVKGLVLPHTASWVNPHDLPVPTALRHMLHSISSLVRALVESTLLESRLVVLIIALGEAQRKKSGRGVDHCGQDCEE
jgi:hypothetical protein